MYIKWPASDAVNACINNLTVNPQRSMAQARVTLPDGAHYSMYLSCLKTDTYKLFYWSERQTVNKTHVEMGSWKTGDAPEYWQINCRSDCVPVNPPPPGQQSPPLKGVFILLPSNNKQDMNKIWISGGKWQVKKRIYFSFASFQENDLKNELTETHEINTNNASMRIQKCTLDMFFSTKFVIRHPNVLFLRFCIFNSSIVFW